jgi:anti-sigma B factor antagonist
MAELGPENPAEMTFSVSTEDPNAAVVTISGELDIANVEEIQAAVGQAIADRPKRLVVEVGGLRFADSSAIALWVQWASSVEKFELRNPSPLLVRVISTMGLEQKLQPQS